MSDLPPPAPVGFRGTGADALDLVPGEAQPDTTALVAPTAAAELATERPAPRRRRGLPAGASDPVGDPAPEAEPAAPRPVSRRLEAARAVAAAAPADVAGGAMQAGRALGAPRERSPAPRGGGRRGPAAEGRALQPAGRAPGPRPRHSARPVIDLDELWAPVKPDRASIDREFLPGALEILEAPPSPIRVWLIYALCGLVAAALLWSWFGHLDVYADATGKVQASGRTKVVQPILSGQVEKILAGDGDHVKAGAVLIQLDTTTVAAERNVVRDQLFNARAEVVRREAEIRAGSADKVATAPKVDWPADLPRNVVDREAMALGSELSNFGANLASLGAQKAAAVADRDKYKANLAPQQKVIDLLTEHLGMRDQLFKDGWNSRATVLQQQQQLESARLDLVNIQGSLAQAEASIAVLDSKIAVTRQTFVNASTTALVQQQQASDKLRQDLAKADEKVRDMTLTAPIDGVVQATAVTTVGQVVSAGSQLMQVVPEGTPLEIETYILNTDAGFVRAGQQATIKIDTFPYTRYGTLPGTVVKVAADALPGKQAQQQQKDGSNPPSADGSLSATSAAQQVTDLVFPVTVRPDAPGLMVDGRMRPLTSGMTVTVEIRTESRRAIDYILSPLHSLFEQSAQER